MPASIESAFFPSRLSRPLAKETAIILDVDEATGAPRLTVADVFGPESRNGLLCAGDPVNYIDPSGLWTAQIGLSVSGQIGVLSVNWSAGIAFDGHGNIGSYSTPFAGGGAGARASGGVSVAGSNADTIYGLGGLFYNVSGGGGLGASGSVQGFWGNDAITNAPVVGGGFTVGPGAGGGGSAGASHTVITPLWSPASSSGSSSNGISSFVNDWSSSGGQLSGNGGTYSFWQGDRLVIVGVGQTFRDSNGAPVHYGTTGNLYNGAGWNNNANPFAGNLTSTGGGDWQTAGYFPSGGQPGEGFHPVPYELF